MACVKGHIIRVETARVELERIESMSATLRRIARIGVRLTKVCGVDYGVWLLVSPDEPVWMTGDTPALFEVRSNTEWRIEINKLKTNDHGESGMGGGHPAPRIG